MDPTNLAHARAFELSLPPGQCCDWWRIITDLHMHGMSMVAISEVTHIPKSTLNGYKNLGAEPKHSDGMRLVNLWRLRMVGEPPVVMCAIRQSDRVQK